MMCRFSEGRAQCVRSPRQAFVDANQADAFDGAVDRLLRWQNGHEEARLRELPLFRMQKGRYVLAKTALITWRFISSCSLIVMPGTASMTWPVESNLISASGDPAPVTPSPRELRGRQAI